MNKLLALIAVAMMVSTVVAAVGYGASSEASVSSVKEGNESKVLTGVRLTTDTGTHPWPDYDKISYTYDASASTATITFDNVDVTYNETSDTTNKFLISSGFASPKDLNIIIKGNNIIRTNYHITTDHTDGCVINWENATVNIKGYTDTGNDTLEFTACLASCTNTTYSMQPKMIYSDKITIENCTIKGNWEKEKTSVFPRLYGWAVIYSKTNVKLNNVNMVLSVDDSSSAATDHGYMYRVITALGDENEFIDSTFKMKTTNKFMGGSSAFFNFYDSAINNKFTNCGMDIDLPKVTMTDEHPAVFSGVITFTNFTSITYYSGTRDGYDYVYNTKTISGVESYVLDNRDTYRYYTHKLLTDTDDPPAPPEPGPATPTTEDSTNIPLVATVAAIAFIPVFAILFILFYRDDDDDDS